MELFRILDKSNCRLCGEKTCLAFAGKVFIGQQDIDQCPKLSPEVVSLLSDATTHAANRQAEGEAYLNQLKAKVAGKDLAAAADRTGGHFNGTKLTLKILGKDFSVDQNGNLYSDIHITPWLATPFLNYILESQGLAPTGKWVSYRELSGGLQRYQFFHKRCEAAIKLIADEHTDFFNDLVHLFDAREVERQFRSDISVVLLPLPKLPIMICYWKADAEMDSDLHVFFDETADRNLDIDSIFNIGVGLARMFAKITQRHGY